MRSSLCRVDHDLNDSSKLSDPPGTPLRTGFESGREGGAQLSEDAKQRVLYKMRSVDEARARAAKDSRTAYVG